MVQFFPKKNNERYHPIQIFPILVPSALSINVGKWKKKTEMATFLCICQKEVFRKDDIFIETKVTRIHTR